MTLLGRLVEALKISAVGVLEGSIPGFRFTPLPERPFSEGELDFADSVFVIIGLTGDLKGRLVFHVDKPSAAALAGAMMMQDGPVERLDRIALSAITEITNMITGNALSAEPLEPLAIELSPPTLFFGQSISIASLGTSGVALPFTFERGGFVILAALESA